MIKTADRLASIEEYYFSRKLREVRGLVAEGRPIINMGIGSPDLAPSAGVLETMKEALSAQGAHQYQSYQGLPELRQAIADFYQNKFDVTVDPLNEVLPLMGSKEGIMHISMAFLNPGDEVLIPNPGYPTYQAVTKLVGAVVIAMISWKKTIGFPILKSFLGKIFQGLNSCGLATRICPREPSLLQNN